MSVASANSEPERRSEPQRFFHSRKVSQLSFTGRTISFEKIQTKIGNAQSVERGTLPLRLMAHSAG
jgi:hypothetical protein